MVTPCMFGRSFDLADRWFETVPQSMLTLFRIISDGLDWDTVFNPLQQARGEII